MPLYLLDANCFITASRLHYPLDVATSFWSMLASLAQQSTVLSIDKVKAELYSGNDVLANWCKTNLPAGFFEDTRTVIAEYQQIASWASGMSHQYSQAALNKFLSLALADAWLVAYALKHGCVLVTYETPAPTSKTSIKIPDVCQAHGVSWCKPMEMLRQLGKSF